MSVFNKGVCGHSESWGWGAKIRRGKTAGADAGDRVVPLTEIGLDFNIQYPQPLVGGCLALSPIDGFLAWWLQVRKGGWQTTAFIP